MARRLLVLGVSLLATAALVIGCGGGESSGDAGASGVRGDEIVVATSSITMDQFLKRANEACEAERKKLLSRMDAYARANPGATNIVGTPRYAHMVEATFLPTFRAEVEAVRKLGAPSDEDEEVKALLEAQLAAIDDVTAQVAERFGDVEEGFREASMGLEEYGLKSCSVGTTFSGGLLE